MQKSLGAAAAIALTSLLVGAGSPSAARPTPSANDAATGFAARLLAAHNAERSAVAAAGLAWDPALAAQANGYASQLAATDAWGHSPQHSRRGQGENLWMGTRGAFTLERMVGDWASEKAMFRPGVFPHVSSTGRWEDVGHYTQIIWSDTARVGCGLRSSARFDYLVCRYADGGNVMGEAVLKGRSLAAR